MTNPTSSSSAQATTAWWPPRIWPGPASKVLVLERRDVAGGQLAGRTRSAPASRSQPLHPGGRLRPDIVRDLDLARHGYATARRRRTRLRVRRCRTAAMLRLSAGRRRCGDARVDPRAVANAMPRAGPSSSQFMDTAAAIPRRGAIARRCRACRSCDSRAEGLPLAALAWKLRRPRRARTCSASCAACRCRRSSSPRSGSSRSRSRRRSARSAIHGVTLGSMSAGTGYTLIHNWLNRGGLGASPLAGRPAAGSRTALVAALKARGGEMRTDSPASRRSSSTGSARAACASTSGEEIRAPTRRLGRRPAAHPARPGRRAGTAAGIRLAGAVDQDARLGRQGARADGRRARPARAARWSSRRR